MIMIKHGLLDMIRKARNNNWQQELAQCGAVILRMMQFVLDEMEA